jgi:hypothetical protein
VPAATEVEDVNETLHEWFYPTTAVSIAVTLSGADVMNVDFGYDVNGSSVIDDLDDTDPDGDGLTLAGNGRTIGYWKHQHKVAIKGKGRAHVDAATLQGYIDQIEALYLVSPFQFNDADEYAASLAVLSSTSSAMVDLLQKQLLGLEFNTVAGIGLVDHMELQQLLVAWSESLVANASAFTAAELEEAKNICDLINNTGD